MLDKPNSIISILALGSMVGLMAFGAASFFAAPHYKDVVDTAIGVFKDVLLVAGGVKAGLAVQKQD